VLLPLPPNKLSLRIVPNGPHDLAATLRDLERGEVLAREVVVQRRRRESQFAFYPHDVKVRRRAARPSASALAASPRPMPSDGACTPSSDQTTWLPSADTRLDQLALERGQKIAYLFDYGDQWEVRLRLREISAADDGEYPRILESGGDALPQYEEIPEEELGVGD
jgi:hypothetical protein